MTFPPPPPSSQSSIASGTDKSSSTRPTRAQQSAWGSSSASQSNLRRGLTPLATNNLSSSSIPSSTSRGPPQSSSPGPGASTSSPLTSSFSAVLSSARGLSGARNAPSPASTSSPFASFHTGSQSQQPQPQQQQSGQSVSSPKFRAHTPSSGSHLASTAISGGGGIGGGGGGTSSSRGVFSPLSGTTVNSPTGFPSDKPGSSASGAAAHASQSSLTKISIAQVFLLLDSITEKEGKEKWETKAAQIHKVS